MTSTGSQKQRSCRYKVANHEETSRLAYLFCSIAAAWMLRLEVMREGIEDYDLLMESARHAPERDDALARMAMPAFTDYLRDVTQFRKLERELLVLATEAQKK